MPTVLVTGATGFLGQHLVRELIAAGQQVRGLSRSPEGDAVLARLGAVPVRGSLGDAGSLRRAVAGCQAVFHTAADTNTWAPGNAAQTDTNVGGTVRLLAAAREAGVSAFLHTSSVSAYSHLVHETLREDVPQRGGDSWINYERSKYEAERRVRESGLRWVVFQPSHILGPGDRQNWSRLIRLVDQNRLPGAPPGAGAFADVREIARVQVRAWREGMDGEVFLLGGEHASFLALIAEIGRQLGRRTPKRATPALVLKAWARVLDIVSRFTGEVPEITPAAAAFTCHQLRVDSSKAERMLGYRSTPLPQLLADTIAWLRAEGLVSPQDAASK
ncbi:NAD-dependent epimerase/dehydratase family protein [Arenimonas fontis]|uniref:NAD-dependent epimerase/dehydratase family protein n=1 Tax=Arenimonas fontis TaxID=2608255 RepID=A0A5B2Z9K0_9GAMM|nr:NAD-dependent epimerase/dehydratase family protein [Arenimonas fontis]KAA2284689.1 NAD-dependent epimerase/dehydratase family protein [Arenimonas fontis]